MAPPIISSRTSKLSTSSRNIENNKNKDTNLSATTNNNHFPSPTLSKTSLEVIERLRNYKIPPDPYGFPKGRAAVMVALFSSRDGRSLNVLLTTRSLSMRTYAGNTALPGGKADPTDSDLVETARREAFEEVGLPIDPTRVEYLTSLRPFPSRSLLLVTPIICLIKDYSIQPFLNPTEVDQVFSFPLHGFLLKKPDEILLKSNSIGEEVKNGLKEFHTEYDYSWYGQRLHRFHAFETLPVPITGLTADILINVAIAAYGRNPDYKHTAIGQLEPDILIEKALEDPKWYQKANENLVAAARLKAKNEAEEELKEGKGDKKGSKL